jgi:hypothetical protein
MRIQLIGDHSAYHCGSAAAFSSLHRSCSSVATVVSQGEDFDWLVVNGEGTMHHGSRGTHKKLEAIAQAIAAGRRADLVNTVWQDNPPEMAMALRGCTEITVREICSQRELARSGINSKLIPDACFFEPIDPAAPVIDFEGQVVATDFWSQEFAAFVRVEKDWINPLPYIDMRAMSWSSLVGSLRTASALVTGRHHAVYAACRAGIPFFALKGNTHKIEGLVESAAAEIPIFTRFTDLKDAVKSGPNTFAPGFNHLFSWLAAQRPWSPEPPAPTS